MDTHSRIQELANNSEIENLRNKSHAKISEFTVKKELFATEYCGCPVPFSWHQRVSRMNLMNTIIKQLK